MFQRPGNISRSSQTERARCSRCVCNCRVWCARCSLLTRFLLTVKRRPARCCKRVCVCCPELRYVSVFYCLSRWDRMKSHESDLDVLLQWKLSSPQIYCRGAFNWIVSSQFPLSSWTMWHFVSTFTLWIKSRSAQSLNKLAKQRSYRPALTSETLHLKSKHM